MEKTYKTYARMPYFSEAADSNGSNEYLYEYLVVSEWSGQGTQPTNNIKWIYGYWLLSVASLRDHAYHVAYYGYVADHSNFIEDKSSFGVHPVINLKL